MDADQEEFKLADCYLMTFDPNADPTYDKTLADKAIGLRSPETHTEFKYSMRYAGVSSSATMADKCRCFRFKNIDYDKHPARWKIDVIHLTDEQEDRIMVVALQMAGLLDREFDFDHRRHSVISILYDHIQAFKVNSYGTIWYGKDALKYDLIGVSISFISTRRIWRPHTKWVWCSESAVMLIQVAYSDFNGPADEQTPSSARKSWRKYSNAA